ncbi:hypothetical protein [uncultured Sulfitobacter sp.]|nr:hypothetical protein [uncultured Sulfitobacter sp.]
MAKTKPMLFARTADLSASRDEWRLSADFVEKHLFATAANGIANLFAPA